MAFAVTLHILFAVIWVGGMFFAHQVLRPIAAELLEPPLRQPLWVGVFNRFFPLVWGAIILIPVTGYWMIFSVFGGFGSVGMHVHLMQLIGWVMIALFLYVYFVPFKKLKEAVAEKAWPSGKAHIDRIRDVVGINMILGLITIAIAAGGRYI